MQFNAIPEPERAIPGAKPWHVLVVDDEPLVLSTTRMALSELEFEGRPLEFHFADGDRAARSVLESRPDVAVALVDVVMESDHAGLDLISHIREERHDSSMRIVLRTGQCGLMPEREALADFDIQAYLDKSATDANRLYAAVLTALRSYREVTSLRGEIRQLESLVALDPLTGLQNASGLQGALAKALGSARRRGEPLSVMFLDVDDFKRINDEQGHLAGDQMLRAIGSAILSRSRVEDGCFRYGGDEFLVILPNCTAQQAHEIYARRLMNEFDRIGARVSYGVAQSGPNRHVGLSALIGRADADMYTRKRARKAARSEVVAPNENGTALAVPLEQTQR